MSLDSLRQKQQSYQQQQSSTMIGHPTILTYSTSTDSQKSHESKNQQDNLINMMQFFNINCIDEECHPHQYKELYTAAVPNNKINANNKRYSANFTANCNMLNSLSKSNMTSSNKNHLVSNMTTNVGPISKNTSTASITADNSYAASSYTMDLSKLQTLNALTLWQVQQQQQNINLPQFPLLQNASEPNNSLAQVP